MKTEAKFLDVNFFTTRVPYEPSGSCFLVLHHQADFFVGRSAPKAAASSIVGTCIEIGMTVHFTSFCQATIWDFSTFDKFSRFFRRIVCTGMAARSADHALFGVIRKYVKKLKDSRHYHRLHLLLTNAQMHGGAEYNRVKGISADFMPA